MVVCPTASHRRNTDRRRRGLWQRGPARGHHPGVDVWTSLAVLLGAGGVALGVPIADPIIGLVISLVILGVVWQSARIVFSRMLDGVDPQILEEIRHAAGHVEGVQQVTDV